MNTSDAIRSFLSRTIPRVYSFVAFPSKNAGTHIAIQKISLQAACIRQKTNPNLQMGSSRSSHGGQEFPQDYGEAEKGPFNWRRTSVHHSFSQQMPDAGVPASVSLLHNQNPCAFGSSATLPAFGITDILASQMSSNPFPSSHQFRRSRSGNEIPNQSQRHYFFGGTAQTSVLESSPSLPYSSYLMEATELNLGGPIALKRPRSGNGAGGCSSQLPTCQADGCWIDLSCAKHYYRRHRVCEYHSKATGVSIAGRIQRFCQQCSRFHLLEEFDEGKRSCRKRLEEHNRRRRKNNHHHLGSSDSPLVDSFPVDDQCNSACLNLYPSHSKQHQKVGEESSSWGFSGMEKQQSLGIEVNEYAENSALSQKMKHMEEEDDGAIQFSSYPFVPLSPF